MRGFRSVALPLQSAVEPGPPAGEHGVRPGSGAQPVRRAEGQVVRAGLFRQMCFGIIGLSLFVSSLSFFRTLSLFVLFVLMIICRALCSPQLSPAASTQLSIFTLLCNYNFYRLVASLGTFFSPLLTRLISIGLLRPLSAFNDTPG